MKLRMDTQPAFKLSLALLIIASAATNTYAKNMHQPIDYKNMAVAPVKEISGFEGWSAGIGLGVMTSAMNSSVDSSSQAAGPPFLSGPPGSSFYSYSRSMVYQFGPMASLFAGYGYLHDIYYAGANIGVNFLGANTLKSVQVSTSSEVVTDSGAIVWGYIDNSMQTLTKVTRGWAEPFLDLKLGGLITPQTLAYGIVGTSYNSLTIKSSSTYNSSGYVIPAPAFPSAASTSLFGHSTTKHFFGLRLGAGMEVLLTQNFGIGADYIYSFYPTYNTSITTNTTTVGCDLDPAAGCTTTAATVTNNTKTSLSDQQVIARFIYHIN